MEKKIKNVLVVVIVAVVVIVGALLFFVVFQDEEDISKFFGTWETIDKSDLGDLEGFNYTEIWTFYQNNSLHVITDYENGPSGDIWSIFDISNGKITIAFMEYEYEFSNNDATLTLTGINIQQTIVLNKI